MRIVRDSRATTAALAPRRARDRRQTGDRALGKVEYRSAGAYVADLYLAPIGDDDAAQRLEVFHRAAAHQTTADNPGLLPGVDRAADRQLHRGRPPDHRARSARPTSAPAPGPTPGSRSTPRSASRPARRPSWRRRKMLITKTPLGADTFGGYVNVSKQDINRTLAGDPRHGHQRPRRAVRDRNRGGGGGRDDRGGDGRPGDPGDADRRRTSPPRSGVPPVRCSPRRKGQGRTVVAVSPDQLGVIGPLFPTVNPQNAYSTGFPVGEHRPGRAGLDLRAARSSCRPVWRPTRSSSTRPPR